jgi:hypothetical protein
MPLPTLTASAAHVPPDFSTRAFTYSFRRQLDPGLFTKDGRFLAS